MISKELLSLVLDREVSSVYFNENECVEYSPKTLMYNINHSPMQGGTINLDTLGRLCKEWCRERTFNIFSGKTHTKMYPYEAWIIDEYYQVKKFKTTMIICDEKYIEETKLKFHSDTELEAIIKATEWVAKQKELL